MRAEEIALVQTINFLNLKMNYPEAEPRGVLLIKFKKNN